MQGLETNGSQTCEGHEYSKDRGPAVQGLETVDEVAMAIVSHIPSEECPAVQGLETSSADRATIIKITRKDRGPALKGLETKSPYKIF